VLSQDGECLAGAPTDELAFVLRYAFENVPQQRPLRAIGLVGVLAAGENRRPTLVDEILTKAIDLRVAREAISQSDHDIVDGP
jgi:hypothetical protein